MAAAVKLSSVCIDPASELQILFKSNSSAVSVQLSPELSSFNEDSSESTRPRVGANDTKQ